jgi:NAD(P)-dependent dehydrogenase (short-subunit alcohol dehydrogenase family)
VAVAGRSAPHVEEAAAAIRGLGRKTLAAAADVSAEQQVAALFRRIEAELGPVDVLVNNAAAPTPPRSVAEMPLEEWNQILAVDLTGAMLCCREALKTMLARRRGVIVNIAGTSGKQGVPYMSAQSAAKHGLIGLTQALALEVASQGVRVNAVVPWAVEGERLRQIRAERSAYGKGGIAPAQPSPMRRVVQPREVAATVLFLVSEAASAITGQAINVTVGMELR